MVHVSNATRVPFQVLATTKTLAKIASKLCKQYPKLNGCCYMHRPEDIEKVLRRFPIGDVWGVGRRWAQLLEKNGVKTAWDFTQLPQAWVRQRMHVVGLRMWSELRGEPCIGFEEFPADKKQIATTRTFDRDIDDFEELHRRIAQYVAAAAEKLRRRYIHRCAAVAHLFFSPRQPTRSGISPHNIFDNFSHKNIIIGIV